MGFISLFSAWLFFLLIPLIIFYFLKLKRQHIKIPSLFLWQQVLNDNRVNSPFQRFKKHILLLLQLLILISLILAAMQPFLFSRISKGKRLPILIDNSASMGSKDRNGKTRLDLAKEEIRQLINQKTKSQQFAIVSFGDTARKCIGFSDNRRVLLGALDKIQIDDVHSDIEDALRMIQAMARRYSFDEALLYSDGNFPEKTDFNLSFELDYHKLPATGPNLGITSLTAQRSGDKSWAVFAMIEGTKNASPATIELYKNGDLIATENFIPGETSRERLVFQVESEADSDIRLKIVPDDFDALLSDNIAFLHLPMMRPLTVYVSPSLRSCRSALHGIQGTRIFPEKDAQSPPPATYDLVVTDNEEDLSRPCVTSLLVGKIPSDLKPFLELQKREDEIIDWQRTSQLLQHVELYGVTLLDHPQFKQKAASRDVENTGYEVLIHGTSAPLLLEKSSLNRKQYFMLFHPDKSTLPYRIGFPILMTNLVNISRQKAGLSDASGNQTGVLPNMKLNPDSEYKIKSPSRNAIHEKTDSEGILRGVPAMTTGVYDIMDGGKKVASVGVSLLNKRESLLAGIEKIQFNELSVEAEKQSAQTPKAIWRWLAIIAFIALIVEWWFFQKRPGKLFGI